MKVPSFATGVLLAVAATGCAPAWKQAGGVSLVVQIDPDSAKITNARATGHKPSKSGLHGPTVTPTTLSDYPNESRELLLAVYHRDGTLIETFGVPWCGLVSWDNYTPASPHKSEGGVLPSCAEQRRLDIPLAAESYFLSLFQTKVLSTSQGLEQSTSLLSTYWLVPHRQNDKPPREIDPPVQGARKNSPGSHPVRDLPEAGVAPNTQGNEYVGAAKIQQGSGTQNFDIVILGDGFGGRNDAQRSADSGRFHAAAQRVWSALAGIEPFGTLKERISVHVVTTYSAESGITDCSSNPGGPPDGKSKDTYFGVQGNWPTNTGPGFTNPGHFGTSHLDVVDATIDKAGLRDQADLVIMLVNCVRYGGNADKINKIVYLPLPDLTNEAQSNVLPRAIYDGLVVHESAHAIASLGDERVWGSCLSPDQLPPGSPWPPNVATQEQVNNKTAPWQSLATTAELNPDGTFVNSQSCAQLTYSGTCVAPDPPVPEPLGAFCGAEFGVRGSVKDVCNDTYCKWSDYYRPANWCMMRDNTKSLPFCRVCACELKRAIWKAAGEAWAYQQGDLCKPLGLTSAQVTQ